jgi:hypothetical protein
LNKKKEGVRDADFLSNPFQPIADNRNVRDSTSLYFLLQNSNITIIVLPATHFLIER